MLLLVCLAHAKAGPWVERLQRALPDLRVVARDPAEPARGGAEQADYIVIGEPSATLFVEQRRVKAVFALSAGVRYLLHAPGLAAAVPIVRLEDAGMAEPMARYALAAALRFALRLDDYAAQQREARWQPLPARAPAELQAGVLGLGVIGRAVARALLAHGFGVRGHARTPKAIDGVRCFAGDAELPAFLGGLDLLVAVLPATDDSAGLLDRHRLALLADGAHVVNLGRGVHLVDDDLLALLDSGKLSGATLDVLRDEPLPPAHPFWRHPRIAITPHVSGPTLLQPSVEQIAGKLRRLQRGEAVSGVVDRQRGY